jgi:ketosteroid isomerase-like protein
VVLDQFASTNERDLPRTMSHYAEEVVLVADPVTSSRRGNSRAGRRSATRRRRCAAQPSSRRSKARSRASLINPQ